MILSEIEFIAIRFRKIDFRSFQIDIGKEFFSEVRTLINFCLIDFSRILKIFRYFGKIYGVCIFRNWPKILV
jgi:hypothetical protein